MCCRKGWYPQASSISKSLYANCPKIEILKIGERTDFVVPTLRYKVGSPSAFTWPKCQKLHGLLNRRRAGVNIPPILPLWCNAGGADAKL